MYTPNRNLSKRPNSKKKNISPKRVTFEDSLIIERIRIKTDPNKRLPSVPKKKNREVLKTINDNPTQIIIPYLKKIEKKKPKKRKKKEILDIKEKNKKKFDKLYGLNDQFIKTIKEIKNEKKSLALQDYQNNLINASTNLSKENILKLYTKLKQVNNISNTIHPLPPVNFDIIYKHSYKENEKLKNKAKISLKDELNQNKELDEFELEQININKGKYLKLQKENPVLYKIYQILPEHVIDVLYKKNKNL